ncbi:MAG: HAD-IIA family hydrolase [Acidobacteriota bacterium]
MIRALLFDLDGTVYRGREAVPGAIPFIAGLADRGVRHLYVTNRSNRTQQRVCDQLRGYGIACEPEEVLTSAEATAEWIGSGSAYCIGEIGLTQALERRGVTLVDTPDEAELPPPPDYVVVGLDRGLTYRKLEVAGRWILAGATFVGTNPDVALNSDYGVSPGAGSVQVALQAMTGVAPTVIGKPEAAMIEIALEHLDLPPGDVVMVGDNLETDIRGGIRAGLRTALVLEGISTRQDVERSDLEPTWIAESFDELSALLFSD